MNKHDNGGPAFPSERGAVPMCDERGHHHGMTLRDYFAAKAMAAMIPLADSLPAMWHDFGLLAESAYAQADAMLAARKEGGTP